MITLLIDVFAVIVLATLPLAVVKREKSPKIIFLEVCIIAIPGIVILLGNPAWLRDLDKNSHVWFVIYITALFLIARAFAFPLQLKASFEHWMCRKAN